MKHMAYFIDNSWGSTNQFHFVLWYADPNDSDPRGPAVCWLLGGERTRFREEFSFGADYDNV